jgi:hypothetical protein
VSDPTGPFITFSNNYYRKLGYNILKFFEKMKRPNLIMDAKLTHLLNTFSFFCRFLPFGFKVCKKAVPYLYNPNPYEWQPTQNLMLMRKKL